VKPKYVLCPGYIRSKNDNQLHYIGAARLADLYRVPIRECQIYEPAPWWPESYYRQAEEDYQNLIWLRPNYNGDYTIPKETSP